MCCDAPEASSRTRAVMDSRRLATERPGLPPLPSTLAPLPKHSPTRPCKRHVLPVFHALRWPRCPPRLQAPATRIRPSSSGSLMYTGTAWCLPARCRRRGPIVSGCTWLLPLLCLLTCVHGRRPLSCHPGGVCAARCRFCATARLLSMLENASCTASIVLGFGRSVVPCCLCPPGLDLPRAAASTVSTLTGLVCLSPVPPPLFGDRRERHHGTREVSAASPC